MNMFPLHVVNYAYVCDTACACKVRSKDFNHEYANAHLLNITENAS